MATPSIASPSTVAVPSALFNPVHVKLPATSFALAVSIVTSHSSFIERKNAVVAPVLMVMTIESADDVGRVPVNVRPAMPTPSDPFTQRKAKVMGAVERGGRVIQETRLWDPDRKETRSMRTKEDAHDYRYFPDPDLLPLILDDDFLDACRAS